MLYVTVNGKENKVAFHHEKEVGEDNQQHPVRTVCVIYDGEKPLGRGVAKVDSRDRFEYKKGRKLALKHALRAAGMLREERKVIWEKYNAR